MESIHRLFIAPLTWFTEILLFNMTSNKNIFMMKSSCPVPICGGNYSTYTISCSITLACLYLPVSHSVLFSMMQGIYYQAQGWFVSDSPSTGPLLGFLATGLCEGWHKGGIAVSHSWLLSNYFNGREPPKHTHTHTHTHTESCPRNPWIDSYQRGHPLAICSVSTLDLMLQRMLFLPIYLLIWSNTIYNDIAYSRIYFKGKK